MSKTQENQTVETAPIELRDWALLIFLSIIWGTAFILIKKSLVSFLPLEVAALRITVSGAVCLPLFFKYIKRIPRDKIAIVCFLGLTSTAIPAFLYAIAQTKISSSVSGSLNTLAPIFTLLFGVLFFNVKSKWTLYLGTLLAFTGAFTMIASKGFSIEKELLLYIGLIVLGAMSYGLSGNIVKYFLPNQKPIEMSIVGYGIWTIPALLILTFGTNFFQEFSTRGDHVYTSLAAIFVLGIVTTAICSNLYFMLIQRTNQIFASFVAYIIPVFAILFGALDGETITNYHLIGLVLVITGVWIGKK